MKVEISKENIIGTFERLRRIMQDVVFDARMLNLAVIRNARELEETAKDLREQKAEIVEEYAAKWSEDEDIPDDREAGQIKVQRVGGDVTPRFPSVEARQKAEQEMQDVFDGTKVFDVDVVPADILECPEGITLDTWYQLDFMIDFDAEQAS